MTDQNDDYQKYCAWIDGFSLSCGYDTEAEYPGPDDEGVADEAENFRAATLTHYLDLPDEIKSIAPFAPPLIDAECIKLLGKSFKDGIGYLTWRRYYHELNLDYLRQGGNQAVSPNFHLEKHCRESGANRGFVLLVLALARHHTVDTSFGQEIRTGLNNAIDKKTSEFLRIEGVMGFTDFIKKGLDEKFSAVCDPDADFAFSRLRKEFSRDELEAALRVARAAGELLDKEEKRRTRVLEKHKQKIESKVPYLFPRTVKKSSLPDIVFVAYEALSEHLYDRGKEKGFQVRATRLFKLSGVPMNAERYRKHKERNP